MSMNDLAKYYALSILYTATFGQNGNIYPSESQWSTYDPPKLTGFTKVKGRRRLTKKQRKQLKVKKQ